MGAAKGFMSGVGYIMLLQYAHLILTTWKSHWEQQKGFCLVRIFHAPSIRELKVTMGAAEGFMPSEGYFMPLQ